MAQGCAHTSASFDARSAPPPPPPTSHLLATTTPHHTTQCPRRRGGDAARAAPPRHPARPGAGRADRRLLPPRPRLLPAPAHGWVSSRLLSLPARESSRTPCQATGCGTVSPQRFPAPAQLDAPPTDCSASPLPCTHAPLCSASGDQLHAVGVSGHPGCQACTAQPRAAAATVRELPASTKGPREGGASWWGGCTRPRPAACLLCFLASSLDQSTRWCNQFSSVQPVLAWNGGLLLSPSATPSCITPTAPLVSLPQFQSALRRRMEARGQQVSDTVRRIEAEVRKLMQQVGGVGWGGVGWGG